LFESNTVPTYYFTGSRTLSVYHARLRNGCSNLNNDLFNIFLKDSILCQCGAGVVDAEHFFFKCSNYRGQRIILFRETRHLQPLGVNTLLFGKKELSEEDNTILFESVQKYEYIKDTKRFSN
jgi:hypothetical protein